MKTDRFNSSEEIEETPLSIAKDIIYSDSTKEEQVRQIVSAIEGNQSDEEPKESDYEEWSELNGAFISEAYDKAHKAWVKRQSKLPEPIKEILENLLYWDTCPEKYKDIIREHLPPK